jgi:type IV pilus assembly protein PilN
MRITINLATRPFTDLGPIIKRLRTAMIVFAVVSVGLGVGLYLLHHKAELARARNHSLDGDIAHITNERQSFEALMRQPENALVLNESAFLNQLFDEKAFSWTLAMEDLETVLPRGVQVTTLEPLRDKEGRITLRLRVVGPRNANVGLVQNLERSKFFLHPTIVGESLENNGYPHQTLQTRDQSKQTDLALRKSDDTATIAVNCSPSTTRQRWPYRLPHPKRLKKFPRRLPNHPRPAQHIVRPVRARQDPIRPDRQRVRQPVLDCAVRPWPVFPSLPQALPSPTPPFVSREPTAIQPFPHPTRLPSPTQEDRNERYQDHIVARTDGLPAHVARGGRERSADRPSGAGHQVCPRLGSHQL